MSVACVLPGGIDTNIVLNTRIPSSDDEETEREEANRLFQKMIVHTTPEKAARIIVSCIKKRRKRILVGYDAYIFAFLERMFPNTWQSLMSLRQ